MTVGDEDDSHHFGLLCAPQRVQCLDRYVPMLSIDGSLGEHPARRERYIPVPSGCPYRISAMSVPVQVRGVYTWHRASIAHHPTGNSATD